MKNLKFNLKDLKHGNKLKLVRTMIGCPKLLILIFLIEFKGDKDYEGSVLKNKVDFSCLVRNEDHESRMTAGNLFQISFQSYFFNY